MLQLVLRSGHPGLSPTVVGALLAQLTQLNGPFPPSALLRGLPRCWRVCQHGNHFVIFSHFILSTSYSTAGFLLVKEHSTADFLRVKEDQPPPWPEGTRNSNYIACQEAPAEPKFSFSLRERHQKENFVNFPTQYHVLCLSKSHKNGNAIQLPPRHCKPL